MAEQGHENDSHFPPEFILRAWAPDHRVRRAWVWDRRRWSENIRHERPEISQRGTVNLRSFDTTFIARGDAQENFRWNRLLENLVAGDIDRVRGSQGPRDLPGLVVFPLEGVLGDTIEPIGHLIFSSVVRVQGHPPAFRSEAKARWYLRQLEQPQSRAQLWERLSSSRQLVLVVLPSPRLALTEWGTIPMQTSVGELLLLPVSPSHALLAAPRIVPLAGIERFLSSIPLPDLSEAVYGVQVCLWPREHEDLDDPDQKIAAAERVRSNMEKFRHLLPLRASIHDEIDG
jgi:hypothetical protein